MSSTQRFHYAGWSAYLCAIATVLSLVSLFLFALLGPPWGALYDAVLLLQLLFALPIALILQGELGAQSTNLQRAAVIFGLALILFAAVAQVLFVFGTPGDQSFNQTLEGGRLVGVCIGLWLFLSSFAGSSAWPKKSGIWTWDERLGLFAAVAAIGYVLTDALFRVGAQSNPLIVLGMVVGGIGCAGWASLLGRRLLSA